MFRVLGTVFGLALAAMAPAAHGQSTEVLSTQSPILTIDQDRLFAETQLGLRSSVEIEAAANALAEENRRIEEELGVEEQTLTDERADLTPEAFTQLADAFDAKVQRIRVEQDAKARALSERQEAARQEFFIEIGGILSEIVRERGAVAIIERRDIFLSADRIDITNEAIERINALSRQPEPDQ